ncbi:MAG: acetyl-CoA carboxylase biotin carboxyl carrier protein [Candidatus Margulisbacteria bacterium]|nr:acetyl-CoA carboxylase biotin carboxyl carrier protein [Candidatus Margulisiibacteriota bacterium]
MVDWELIKKLIQVVKKEEISGLAVEEKGIKYEVRRELTASGQTIVTSPVLPVASQPASAAAARPEAEEEGFIAITSPMVGTFYRSPSPDASPFVELGHEVEPGKVVCIIEAMKLFNEIEAEIRGKVVKILVENGQPVEYGQKLMLVKKG